MMNFLNRLFGESDSKNNNPDKTQQNKKKETTSYRIDLEEAGVDFYPFFSQFSSNEISANNLVDIFHYDQDENPKIVTTYVTQDDEGVSMVNSEDMEDGLFEAFGKAALKCLDKSEIKFEFHPEYKNKILVSQGSLFTCEAILSKKHMLKAHALLNSETIQVAIPRRGMMMICSDDASQEQKKDFMNLHMYFWIKDDEGPEPLCDDIFILKNGEIDGILYLNQS